MYNWQAIIKFCYNTIQNNVYIFDYLYDAPAKRSQHANATYRNIVGCRNTCAFGHGVSMCCDMLSVVGSSLKWSNLSQQHPTCRNTSQHGGQTHTCYTQQCCDMLRWHVAIVWSGLKRLLMSVESLVIGKYFVSLHSVKNKFLPISQLSR